MALKARAPGQGFRAEQSLRRRPGLQGRAEVETARDLGEVKLCLQGLRQAGPFWSQWPGAALPRTAEQGGVMKGPWLRSWAGPVGMCRISRR